MDQLP
ncbi:unnamed protein product [Linum tenue]